MQRHSKVCGRGSRTNPATHADQVNSNIVVGLRKTIMLIICIGLVGLLTAPSSDAQLSEEEYPLFEPTNYKIALPTIHENRNGKMSHVYTHTDHRSYQGQHQYACGVKGDYSTFAYYDFGNISDTGTYEVYAYWPAFNESVGNRNNGDGNFDVWIDGTAKRRWRERDQWGGWERIDFGSWAPTKHHGRTSYERRSLVEGQKLEFTIHNGNSTEEGTCSPGPRIVFPPLLLLRIEDYPNSKPYSPAHDIYPLAALSFVNCIHTSVDLLSSDDKVERILAFIEALAYGAAGEFPGPGSISNQVKIDDYRTWVSRVFNCEIKTSQDCEAYDIRNQWHPPIVYPNNSVLGSARWPLSWPHYHQYVYFQNHRGWYPEWLHYCFSSDPDWGKHHAPDRYVPLKMMPITMEMDAYARNGLR